MLSKKEGKTRVLVDGVFFQLARSGIARVWSNTLPILAQLEGLEIVMLNRGNAPVVDGVKSVPYPFYFDAFNADDSISIQRLCDFFEIDVFITTYYTTPTRTPSVLVVYDMIPERFGFDLSHRHWREKDIAIKFARQFVCISQKTTSDLLEFYPHLEGESIITAYPGVDPTVFNKQSEPLVREFKNKYQLKKEYFLLVGSRQQHLNYKNGDLFFRAICSRDREDFDILAIGGERELAPEVASKLPRGVEFHRIDASDDELATAYTGAIALVYPSLYEGFGLPVVEAMASHCPVITTEHGSLGEIAPGAAITISGYDENELLDALNEVRNPDSRSKLIAAGFERSREFRWNKFGFELEKAIDKVRRRSADGEYKRFLTDWEKLRLMQAEIDESHSS